MATKKNKKNIKVPARDVSQLKKIVTTLTENDASLKLEREDPLLLSRRRGSQRAIGELFKKFFEKSGLQSPKLDKLILKRRAELKDIIKKQGAEAKSLIASNHDALDDALQSRRNALEVMTGAFTPALVTLDKPFLIWQYPHPELDIFIDSHIESANSFVTVYVDKKHGGDDTQFKFHFLWTNESDAWSLVNVTTSLILNGLCIANADLGYVDGDSVKLLMQANLYLMRWSGWPPDPNGKPADQTYEPIRQASQGQNVVNWYVAGYGYFGGGPPGYNYQRQVFTATPFDLSYRLFPVPPRGVAIFEVSLRILYGIQDGNDDSLVLANFFDRIFCPWVQLEVLTPTATVPPLNIPL
jgi:hypothetical protein